MYDGSLLNQLRELGIDTKDISRTGEVKSLCPSSTHEDHSPSFFFNLYTQKYICFRGGCIRGCGINQLRYQLTGEKRDSINIAIPQERETKRKVTPRIPFNLPLAINNSGEEYLKSRGISRDSINLWSLKYWPSHLVKGFFDTPVESVVIPIHNVGFIERFIGVKDHNKKYKYVAGTRIETALFGIENFNSESKSAIIVEGSLDAIWLHQLGFTNTLAILHSDISQMQLNILRGATFKINIMLDNDQGGVSASNKLIPMLKNYFIVYNCKLPSGKDPNDCTKEEIELSLNNAERK